MSIGDAPARRQQLRDGYRVLNRAIPDQMRGFGDLHRSAVADGALSSAHKELIALAIGIAGPEDTVVIAGKGHEDYQIIGRDKLPFSDTDEARRALERRAEP